MTDRPSPPTARRDASAGIAAAALLLGASNLVSRVLGFGRDWLINFEFGATGQTDVYQASFTLPDFINYLLAGGALSVSLLPRMAELYAKRDGPADGITADRAFSVVCSAMIVAATVLVGLAMLAANPIIRWWFPGFTDQQVELTTHLTRIVLPAQLFFLVGGLFQAALLARQQFRAMALTPLLYNAGIIVGGLLGGKLGQIEGFSWGALAGALLGGLAVPVLAARPVVRMQFVWAPTHPEVKRFLWVAAPLMIGVSLTTVDEWLAKHYASALQAGAISWLMTARRVMLVPVGLLGAAAGQATGAFLARLHAEGDRVQMAQVLARAMAATVSLSLLFAGILCALAEPIVRLLFAYGKFGEADVQMTANALQVLAWAVPVWGAQQVMARAFYAVGDTWRPMIATSLVTVVMLPVYAHLSAWPGREIAGLCAAGVVGIALQAVALTAIAGRRLGFDGQAFLRAVAPAAAVASVGGVLAAVVDGWIGSAVTQAAVGLPFGSVIGRVIRLALGAAPWAVVIGVAASMTQLPGLPGRVQRLVRPASKAS